MQGRSIETILFYTSCNFRKYGTTSPTYCINKHWGDLLKFFARSPCLDVFLQNAQKPKNLISPGVNLKGLKLKSLSIVYSTSSYSLLYTFTNGSQVELRDRHCKYLFTLIVNVIHAYCSVDLVRW